MDDDARRREMPAEGLTVASRPPYFVLSEGPPLEPTTPSPSPSPSPLLRSGSPVHQRRVTLQYPRTRRSGSPQIWIPGVLQLHLAPATAPASYSWVGVQCHVQRGEATQSFTRTATTEEERADIYFQVHDLPPGNRRCQAAVKEVYLRSSRSSPGQSKGSQMISQLSTGL